MILALVVMTLGLGLMVFSVAKPTLWITQFLPWVGMVLVMGSALWMGLP